MMRNILPEYLSAGCNQSSKSFDWCHDLNIICYGSDNGLVVLSPKDQKLVGISNSEHEGRVCCVKWIKKDSWYIVSSDSEGFIKIWKYKSRNPDIIDACLQLHHSGKYFKQSINALDVIMRHEDTMWIVASANNQICGWAFDLQSGEEKKIFSYDLPYHAMVLDLRVVPLDSMVDGEIQPMIMYGGDDSKLHLMIPNNETLSKIGVLSGQEDWIYTFDFTYDDNNDLLLASGSKDGSVRIWRISKNTSDKEKDDLRLDDVQILIPLNGSFIASFCSLESVLHGHQGLVSQVKWNKNQEGNLELLSSAKTQDRSVIVWSQSIDDGNTYWLEKSRLGEVGGNREGFVTASFGPHASTIVAVSYQGGLHLWSLDEESWKPLPLIGGHFSDVTDLDWHREGRYLVTTSKDQTTRIHCQINVNNESVWQEISRPQVHGYDMVCVTHLQGYKFASGAEEYVIRSFSTTMDFVKKVDELTGTSYCQEIEASPDMPERASVPSLGLSNKAIDDGKESTEEFFSYAEIGSSGPPNEDQLMIGTLWPEISKLYGHGNEILAITSSHDGKLIASSCRANNELDACIIIWETNDWNKITSLIKHRLSVVQMSFSPCDQYLLSVSRDRSWCLHSRNNDKDFVFCHSSSELPKAEQHSRIIWSCDWLPLNLLFVTGSRDKKVIVWGPNSDPDHKAWKPLAVSDEADEVTAVAACQTVIDEFYVLIAIGTVKGKIIVRKFDTKNMSFKDSLETQIHKRTVRRLKFQPSQDSSSVILASCGADNAVFIQRIL